MPEDLTGLGKAVEAAAKLVDCDMSHRIYDDIARGPLQELSGISTDLLQGFRLFTVPFVLAAHYRTRLLEYVSEVRQRVPKEHQVEAPAEIAGPVFERLRFLERDHLLTDLYLQILTNSIDSRCSQDVHPAFIEILGQLSRDEALLLHYLKLHGQLRATYRGEFDELTGRCSRVKVVQSPVGLGGLDNPQRLFVYLTRMMAQYLTEWPNYCDEVHKLDCGRPIDCLCTLTEFGELFVGVCIPDDISPSVHGPRAAG